LVGDYQGALRLWADAPEADTAAQRAADWATCETSWWLSRDREHGGHDQSVPTEWRHGLPDLGTLQKMFAAELPARELEYWGDDAE
jgi:hypothetical protein